VFDEANRANEGHQHMLMFSDMLSEGIAKQFPGKIAQNK